MGAASLLAGCLAAAAAAVSAVKRVMVKKSGLGMVAGERRRDGTRKWWRGSCNLFIDSRRVWQMMAAAVANAAAIRLTAMYRTQA